MMIYSEETHHCVNHFKIIVISIIENAHDSHDDLFVIGTSF